MLYLEEKSRMLADGFALRAHRPRDIKRDYESSQLFHNAKTYR